VPLVYTVRNRTQVALIVILAQQLTYRGCEFYLPCLVLSIAFRRCGRLSVVYVASGGFGTNMAVGRVGLAARTGRCKSH
jgi:hypothetical protein